MKKLTIRQMAAVKRTAQNVNPLVLKKNKILVKAQELVMEAKQIEEEIKGFETGIMSITGGMVSEQLVTRVVETVEGKTDKEGNPVKITKYVPTSRVSFNVEENCYYITEDSDIITSPSTEGMAGSDFDIDADQSQL